MQELFRESNIPTPGVGVYVIVFISFSCYSFNMDSNIEQVNSENPQQTVIQQPIQSIPVEQESSGNKTPRNTGIVTILLLIFIYPVGVLLMWFLTKWRRWLKILLSIPLLLSILFVGVFVYFGHKYDIESKAYTDKEIPKIINSWDISELMSQESPEFKQSITQDQLNALFNKFSMRLGNLKEYKGSVGGATFLFSKPGHIVSASYIIQATFEKAPAKITVDLVSDNGKWSIEGLTVFSEALLN